MHGRYCFFREEEERGAETKESSEKPRGHDIMTSKTFCLEGRLEAMRTLERKNCFQIKTRSGRRVPGSYLALKKHQDHFRMEAKRTGMWDFMDGAKHITLSVGVHRKRLMLDSDNLAYSFNKIVIDPLVTRRKKGIITHAGVLEDDSEKYLTIESIRQNQSDYEFISIVIERS